MTRFTKERLIKLYIKENKSVAEIAKEFGCSENGVNYWIKKYNIQKRTISEAVYIRNNPQGDPFKYQEPRNINEAFLCGLGLGLYWGEGTRSNKHCVRLGNTDPKLIKKFILFLKKIYNIDSNKLKFGLQIFSDMDPNQALKFWVTELKVSRDQFQKVIVTPSRGVGTYKNKIEHGVLTVHFNNKKLRDIICDAIVVL